MTIWKFDELAPKHCFLTKQTESASIPQGHVYHDAWDAVTQMWGQGQWVIFGPGDVIEVSGRRWVCLSENLKSKGN